MIRARIEPELKDKVEKVFNELGLTITEAITLFYKQVDLNKGLPFPVKIPNKITLQAIEEVENGIGLTEYQSTEDMFKALKEKCFEE